MDKWEKQGRFLAIRVCNHNRWIVCVNAYAQTYDSSPFLAELYEFLVDRSLRLSRLMLVKGFLSIRWLLPVGPL